MGNDNYVRARAAEVVKKLRENHPLSKTLDWNMKEHAHIGFTGGNPYGTGPGYTYPSKEIQKRNNPSPGKINIFPDDARDYEDEHSGSDVFWEAVILHEAVHSLLNRPSDGLSPEEVGFRAKLVRLMDAIGEENPESSAEDRQEAVAVAMGYWFAQKHSGGDGFAMSTGDQALRALISLAVEYIENCKYPERLVDEHGNSPAGLPHLLRFPVTPWPVPAGPFAKVPPEPEELPPFSPLPDPWPEPPYTDPGLPPDTRPPPIGHPPMSPMSGFGFEDFDRSVSRPCEMKCGGENSAIQRRPEMKWCHVVLGQGEELARYLRRRFECENWDGLPWP